MSVLSSVLGAFSRIAEAWADAQDAAFEKERPGTEPRDDDGDEPSSTITDPDAPEIAAFAARIHF